MSSKPSWPVSSFLFVDFLYAGGAFTEIRVPGVYSPVVSGINNAGQLLGAAAIGPSSGSSGFLYDYVAGTLTIFDAPGAIFFTLAGGGNDAGQIVGVYRDGTKNRGFLATPSTVPEPGTLALVAAGVAVLAGVARWRGSHEALRGDRR